MSVSVRPYTSAPLAMLTAGVVLSGAALSGAALVSAPGAQAAPSLLKSGYHLGIDTIGQTLKNANLQIRSQPPNPQLNTGPWNQSLAVGVDAAAVAVTFSASLITYVRAGNIGQDNLYNSFAAVASAPSVMAAVARFNTDWALLFNRSQINGSSMLRSSPPSSMRLLKSISSWGTHKILLPTWSITRPPCRRPNPLSSNPGHSWRNPGYS